MIKRKVLFTTGDRNALDYGGGVVYRVTATVEGDSGSEWVNFEWWGEEEPILPGGGVGYYIYRRTLYPDMLRELDWLKTHVTRCSPAECPPRVERFTDRPVGEWLWRPWNGQEGAWRVSNYLRDVAKSTDTTPRELARMARSSDLRERVRFIEAVRDHFGSWDLDQYPLTMIRAELRRRWRHHIA